MGSRKSTVITHVKDRFQQSYTVFLSSPRSSLHISHTRIHFRHVLRWAYFCYTKSSTCKCPPPTLPPLSCRCNSAYPSFPTDFHNLILKKRTRTLLLFPPPPTLSSFPLPFTCANQFQPVIILPDQSCQFPFFCLVHLLLFLSFV